MCEKIAFMRGIHAERETIGSVCIQCHPLKHQGKRIRRIACIVDHDAVHGAILAVLQIAAVHFTGHPAGIFIVSVSVCGQGVFVNDAEAARKGKQRCQHARCQPFQFFHKILPFHS